MVIRAKLIGGPSKAAHAVGALKIASNQRYSPLRDERLVELNIA
jgi:hypothetical protein